MIKEEINLLSPTILALRMRTVYMRHASHVLGAAVTAAGLVVVALALAAAVTMQSTRFFAFTNVVDQGPSPDNQKTISAINTMVSLAKGHFENRIAWLPLLGQAISQVPQGMSVTDIQVDAGKKLLRIQGTAPIRSDVVVLENRLRALPWVGTLDAPLQNFAANPATSFSFTLRYKDSAK